MRAHSWVPHQSPGLSWRREPAPRREELRHWLRAVLLSLQFSSRLFSMQGLAIRPIEDLPFPLTFLACPERDHRDNDHSQDHNPRIYVEPHGKSQRAQGT